MRIIMLILCLLLPGNANAFDMVVGAPVSSCNANCGICGTYVIGWDGDWPSDTDKACSGQLDTTGIDGTLNSVTLGTDYGESGSVGMQISDSTCLVTYTVTGQLDPSKAQTVWIRIYVSANPSNDNVYLFRGVATATSSTDYVTLALNSTGQLVGNYRNSTINVSNYTGAANVVATGQWVNVAYSWDPTNQDHDITHNGSTWSEDANELTTASAWTCNEIRAGNTGGDPSPAGYVYIDRWAVVDGYRASLPSGW